MGKFSFSHRAVDDELLPRREVEARNVEQLKAQLDEASEASRFCTLPYKLQIPVTSLNDLNATRRAP